MLEDTIVAIATGYDIGAISIIRMSGEDTFTILKEIFSKNLDDKDGYTLHHGDIINNGEVIDEVMVGIYRNPKSYTGEDMAEIFCHGGAYVTNEVLQTLLDHGAKMAERGEFTQRAYLNGKLDLSEAEAVNDVINASNKDQLVLAEKELKGSVRKLLEPLKEDMVNLIGNIEVNIDYPEYEDVEVIESEIVYPKVKKWINEIDEILVRSESGKIVRSGIKTAIVGRANAGKSSLFNALLEEEKAIVTEIPGTTRDVVEGEIRLRNCILKLQDTAGLRETDDKVENIGIQKTKESIEDSDLVIVVLDGSSELVDEDYELLDITSNKERIVVFNKMDLTDIPSYGIWISAKENKIDALVKEIENRFSFIREVINKPALSNERQIQLMKKAKNYLNDALVLLNEKRELDLVNIDLNGAHSALCEIDGTYTKEDLLDDIFERFCLGK